MNSENPSVSRDTNYLEIEEVMEKLCIAKGIEAGARILVLSKNDAEIARLEGIQSAFHASPIPPLQQYSRPIT